MSFNERGRVEVGKLTPFTTLRLSDEIRPLHLRIAGEPGTGKTYLAALIAFQDAQRRIPTIIVDGNGGLIDAFIRLALTQKAGPSVLDRLVFFPLNRFDWCHGFPFFVRDNSISVYDHAQTLIETIMRVNPSLDEVATTLRHVGTTTAMALYETGYQVTESVRFLEDKPFRAHVLRQLDGRLPEVARFYGQYDRWSERDRTEQSRSFKTKVAPYILSDELCAIVGQDRPTIHFADIEARGLIVALDLSQTKEYPARVIGSVFIDRLSQYIFGKPISRCAPISLIVDEAATLLAHPGMAADFREFQSRARAFKLWMTVCHQTMHQLDDDLRVGLWSIANQIIFRQHEIESATEVARNLIPVDPYMVKYENLSSGNPTALPVAEQTWAHGNWIQSLPDRRALVRTFEKPGIFGGQPWKMRLMTTPTLNLQGALDARVEAAKEASLRRFGRPVAEALAEIKARGDRHLRRNDRPLRESA